MKKTLIAVAAAAALATSSAFAEITFGAWLRSVLVPIANDGGDSKDFRAGLTQSWGGAARTSVLGVNWITEDGNAGSTFEIRNPSDGTITMGDRSVMWFKPVEMLKLSVGLFDSGDNGFREGWGFGAWNWLRPNRTTNLWFNGDDSIMDGTGGRSGLMAELTPIEGLTVMAIVPYATVDNSYVSTDWSYNVYKKTQAGVAYSIDGIGKVKVLWTGQNEVYKANDKKYDYMGDIGVAFDLTAVENLYVAVGGKFSIADKEYCNAVNDKQLEVKVGKTTKKIDANTLGVATISLAATYNVMENLAVSLAGGVKIFRDSDFDPQFGIGGGIEYGIMDGLKAVADVRYMSKMKGEKKVNNVTYEYEEDDAFSFLVGIQKNVANSASIGIGFEGVTNGAGFAGIPAGKDKEGKAYDGFMWSVPVVFELSF
ncbi:MAG: hypothetical protein J6K96_01350 [Treponema sp.]|nr:hypothetical protein [Treponema sp.]